MTVKHRDLDKFKAMGIPERFVAPFGNTVPSTPPGTKAMKPLSNEDLVPDENWQPKKVKEEIHQKVKTHGYITRLLANCGAHAKPETIIKAVTAYVAYGNFRKAADDAGVKERTLRRWADTEWWPEVTEYVTRVIDLKLEGQMTSIIEKAVAAIEDRIDNGDPIVFKGEVTGRKPLDATQLAKLFGVSYDKRLLQKGASVARGDGDRAQDRLGRLESIAERLEESARAIKPTGNLIEGSKQEK